MVWKCLLRSCTIWAFTEIVAGGCFERCFMLLHYMEKKAANGVIVIERKNRFTDKNIRVRYNFVPGFGVPDVDSYDYCRCDFQKVWNVERFGQVISNTAEGKSVNESYNEKI